MKVSKRKIRPWRIVEIQFFRVFFVTLHSSILLFKTYVSVVLTILHAADTHRWESGKAADEPTAVPTDAPNPPIAGAMSLIGVGIAAIVASAGVVIFRKKEED